MNKKINLEKYIRSIPDFPKKGILFRDITPLLKEKALFKKVIRLLGDNFKDKKIDYVVAVESRGFILGGAIAYHLDTGFIPVRKKGKLPYKTISVTYELEYGTDTLEMHIDALSKNKRVLIVDDLLATGGTAKAVAELVRKSGAKVIGIVFLVELTELKGRENLKDYPVFSLIKF